MLRFKIRTLLIVTAIFALIAGYYANRLIPLSQEQKGLNELREDWYVHKNPIDLFDPFSEKPKRQDNFFTVLDWPIKKWLAFKGTSKLEFGDLDQVRSLELYASTDELGKSLRGLNALDRLEHLRFDWSRATCSGISIDKDQIQRIGRLSNLKRLEFCYCGIDAEALTELNHLQLTHLICGQGDWTETEVELVSKFKTLEHLNISTDDEVALDALATLPHLKTLEFWADEKTDLSFLARIPKLEKLEIYGGRLTEKQIDSFKSAKQLKHIGFKFAKFKRSAAIADVLVQFPALDLVEFGYQKILKNDFLKLTNAGLDVTHDGFSDFKPEKNYLKYGSIYALVDFENSELFGTIDMNKPGVDWRIRIGTTDAFYPTTRPALRFESPFVKSLEDWRHLEGLKTVVPDRNAQSSGNLYDGSDQTCYENLAEFVGREKNEFHVKWQFVTSYDEENGYGMVDARVKLKKVMVESLTPITFGQAKKRLAKYLDINDFEMPDSPPKQTQKRFTFSLRQGVE